MKGCDEHHEVAAPMNRNEVQISPADIPSKQLASHNGDRKECRPLTQDRAGQGARL
jgi:hypothetical protein